MSVISMSVLIPEDAEHITVMNWVYCTSSKSLKSYQTGNTLVRDANGRFICVEYKNAVPHTMDSSLSTKEPVFFFIATGSTGRLVFIRADFSYRVRNTQYEPNSLTDIVSLFKK